MKQLMQLNHQTFSILIFEKKKYLLNLRAALCRSVQLVAAFLSSRAGCLYVKRTLNRELKQELWSTSQPTLAQFSLGYGAVLAVGVDRHRDAVDTGTQ
jgi:hypothetical protein